MAKWTLDGTGCIVRDGKPIPGDDWLGLKARIVALLNAAEPGGDIERMLTLANPQGYAACQSAERVQALLNGAANV